MTTMKNMSVNVSKWLMNFLNQEEARCVQARNIISRFLDEIREIEREGLDITADDRQIFTSYFSQEDLEYARYLKEKKIFFSFSEIARIAFFEHYRAKRFKCQQLPKKKPKPKLDYLQRNNIIVIKRLEY